MDEDTRKKIPSDYGRSKRLPWPLAWRHRISADAAPPQTGDRTMEATDVEKAAELMQRYRRIDQCYTKAQRPAGAAGPPEFTLTMVANSTRTHDSGFRLELGRQEVIDALGEMLNGIADELKEMGVKWP